MAEDKHDSLETETETVKAIDITVDALGEKVIIPSSVVALSPVLQAALGKNWNHDECMKLPYSADAVREMIARQTSSIDDYLQLPTKNTDWFSADNLFDEAGKIKLADSEIKYAKMPMYAGMLRMAIKYKDTAGIISYSCEKDKKQIYFEIHLCRNSIRCMAKNVINGLPNRIELVKYCLRKGLLELFEKSILGEE